MKVLLDTDIGSDIDDAVCLAYLLSRPDCELLGITTVSGEPELRASIASSLCMQAGRRVPIAVGAASPLLVEQLQPRAPQAEALPRWPHATAGWAGLAVELMSSTIRRHPGQVVLLAIGPLTNVALLTGADPAAVGMLKGLVIMGGDFSSDRPSAEWNIRCDPHAAAMVFRAHFPSVRVVGLDITRSVSLTKEEVRAHFTAPLLEPVLDYAGIWFREHDTLIFHDPLTAATIFEESLCSFRRGHVEVSLDSICEPFTSWKPDDAKGPHEVARSVDRCRYFEHLSRVLQAGPNSPPR